MARGDDGNGPAKVTRLREEIDRGGTGDKVAFQDPAAAPLGTDDEAAGTPPTAAQAEAARAAETKRAAPEADKPRPRDLLRGHPPRRVGLTIVAAVVLLGLLVWLV